MSPRRVLLALIGLVAAMSPILVLRVYQEIEILRVADQYHLTRLVVASSHCSQDSSQRSYCFLEGSVNGAAERLAVGREQVKEHLPGSEIPIFYAPELDAFGSDHQNLRLQWGDGDPW